MIMNQSLPGFSGFGSVTTNLGEVQNRGVEISLSTTNIKNDVLEWNTTIGFSFNKNEIKHLYYEYENVLNAQGEVIGTKERDDISNKWFIGQPIGAIWDYKVTGIWQKEIAEAFPGIEIVQNPLSLSVACHIGHGAIAVACSRKVVVD